MSAVPLIGDGTAPQRKLLNEIGLLKSRDPICWERDGQLTAGPKILWFNRSRSYDPNSSQLAVN